MQVLKLIRDTYKTNTKFKEQIKHFNLRLDEVGVTIFNHHPKSSDATILDSYKSDSPIVLYFSKEDNKVVSQSISL